MDLRIFPPEDLIEQRIQLPISKSIENRILIMRALEGIFPEENSLTANDDIESLAKGLVYRDKAIINVGAAGTAMRFLTAYYSITPGVNVILDGSERMRNRPIGELVKALNSLGADIKYENKEGYPPLKICGRHLNGGKIEIPASVSSQYISALMLIAPYMQNGLEILLQGDIVSKSYILMTLELQRMAGIDVELDENRIIVHRGNYDIGKLLNEPDWTAASYWAEIVALSAGFISLQGLSSESVQGDRKIIDFFDMLGVNIIDDKDNASIEMSAHPEVHSRINIDLSDNPDLAQTLAVTCCLLNIPFEFSGLSTLKIKETDRITALKNELVKLGFLLETNNVDKLSWDGKTFPIRELPEIETYNDHRMALSFAPVAIYLPGLIIKNAEVVNKSYPTFWDDLRKAGFNLEEL